MQIEVAESSKKKVWPRYIGLVLLGVVIGGVGGGAAAAYALWAEHGAVMQRVYSANQKIMQLEDDLHSVLNGEGDIQALRKCIFDVVNRESVIRTLAENRVVPNFLERWRLQLAPTIAQSRGASASNLSTSLGMASHDLTEQCLSSALKDYERSKIRHP